MSSDLQVYKRLEFVINNVGVKLSPDSTCEVKMQKNQKE